MQEPSLSTYAQAAGGIDQSDNLCAAQGRQSPFARSQPVGMAEGANGERRAG